MLSSEGEKLNSMNLLLYMAPMAVVFLLPATLFMEENVVGITLALARDDVKIIWYLLFNSALACFVNLANFLVTKHTSALTLQVLGNAKELYLLFSSLWRQFQDSMRQICWHDFDQNPDVSRLCI